MKTLVALAAFAMVVGLAGLAQAAQLTSPPLTTHPFATNHENTGACSIRNVGTTPVIVDVSLFSNNATVPFADTCRVNGQPRSLPAGQTCAVGAVLPDDSFVACTVKAASVVNLRGTLEVLQDFNTILWEDLR